MTSRKPAKVRRRRRGCPELCGGCAWSKLGCDAYRPKGYCEDFSRSRRNRGKS